MVIIRISPSFRLVFLPSLDPDPSSSVMPHGLPLSTCHRDRAVATGRPAAAAGCAGRRADLRGREELVDGEDLDARVCRQVGGKYLIICALSYNPHTNLHINKSTEA